MSAVLRMTMRTGRLGQGCGIMLHVVGLTLSCIGACVLLVILGLRRVCSWVCDFLAFLCGS